MKIMENIPVWGDHEEKTLEQVRTCAATADRAALMADGHLGYAVPIGGVVAYKDAISPSGVGFDIACGNKAVRLDMPGEELRAKIGTIMDDVWATLSFGVVVPTLSQHESLLPRVASEAARSPIDRLPFEAKIEWIGEHVRDTKLRR